MNDENEALDNCRNRHQQQRDYKTVLCLCSAGLLRSPTAAFVLSQEPYNYNTRSAGVHGHALIPLSTVLIEWADEIVVLGDKDMARMVESYPHFKARPKPLKVLNIPDKYAYRDKELMQLIGKRYADCKIMEKAVV